MKINRSILITHFRQLLSRHRHPVAFGILLALTLIAFFCWNLSRWEFREGVHWLGGRMQENVSAGSVKLADFHTLQVRDLAMDDFARIEFLELKWTFLGLATGKVESLNVQGAHLWLRGLQAAGEKRKSRIPSTSIPIHLGCLILRDATLMLDNLGTGLPAVPITVGSLDPLVFYDLYLGGSGNDKAARAEQTVDIDNLVISSPYDPLTPVLKFKKVKLKFTWQGIQQQHLDSLVVDSPLVYVGNDLFYFADELSARSDVDARGGSKPAKPWTLGRFELIGGRLVLVSFGRPGFMLPFVFQAISSSLVLDDFASLPFDQIGFEIPPANLNYPEIGLRLNNMQGKLYMKIPPDNPGAHNLVPAITIDSAEWKGLKSGKLGVSMTFDRRGIFAELKGEVEKGYLTGGFQIQLDDLSWLGWGSLTQVELGRITGLLSPENFVIQGRVNTRFVTHGRSKSVDGLGGFVSLDNPGKMHIPAVDDLLKKIPGDWWITKRDLLEISLRSFREYDYSSGRCDFVYFPPESFLKLSMDGLQGTRNFDIRWHDKRDKPGLGF